MSEDIIDFYRKANVEKISNTPVVVASEEFVVDPVLESVEKPQNIKVEDTSLNSFLSILSDSIQKEKEKRATIQVEEKIIETPPKKMPIIEQVEERKIDITKPDVIVEGDPLNGFLDKFQNIVKASKEKKVKATTLEFINNLKNSVAKIEEDKKEELPIKEDDREEIVTEPVIVVNEEITEQEQELPEVETNEVKPGKKYVGELKALDKKVKKIEKPVTKPNDIKTLISQQVEAQTVKITDEVKAYARRILDLGGGGGSVAQQFANGGTMNGSLNVTGRYLSAGVELSTLFGTGGGGGLSGTVDRLVSGDEALILNSDGTVSLPNNTLRSPDDIELILESENTALSAFTQIALTPHGFFAYDTNGNTITFDSISDNITFKTVDNYSWILDDAGFITGPNNVLAVNGSVNVTSGAYLSAGINLLNLLSGSSTGDAAVNSLVHSNSALWNTTYTTVSTNSASWSSVYTTVQAVSSQWGADYTAYTNLTANSANWQSTFNTVSSLSSNWNSAYSIATSYQSTSGNFATTLYVDTNYLPLTGGTVTGRLGVNNTPNSYDLDLSSLGNSYGDLAINAYNNVIINPQSNVILAQHTGSVGIGITDPAEKLDVDGNIQATGTIAADSGDSGQWSTAYSNSLYAVNGTANQITATPVGDNTGNNSVTLSLPSNVVITTLNILSTLNVAGSANFYNTNNLNVSSNIIYFGEGNTGNALDLGLVTHFVGGLNNGVNRYQHTGLARQAGQNSPAIWTLFSGLTTEPGDVTSGINWSDPYLTLDTLSANILGNLSGSFITVGNGNSNQWNNVYTTVQSNSSNYVLINGNTRGTAISIGTTDNNNFNFITNNTNRVTITSGGSVGIGTTPSYPLDVNGKLRSSSGFILGSDISLLPSAGGQSAVTTWWGMQLIGNKQSTVDYAPANIGNRNDFNVIIPNSQINSTNLIIQGTANQTSNLQLWRNSSLSALGFVSSTGNAAFVGTLSSANLVYDKIGNSNQWNNAYTTVKNISANSVSVYTTVTANSANWNNAYTTANNISANSVSVYTSVNANSANWNSVYTTANNISANSVSVYTNVNANSANWNNAYTSINNISANDISVYTSVNANSANWNNAYSTINAISANDVSVYTTVTANSANWNSVYTTANTISANSVSVYTSVNANSANWNSVYTTVKNISANDVSVYTSVNTNSANWNNAYSYVNSASSTLVSSNTAVVTNSNQITNIVYMTQANYNALGTYNASTVYIIVG